MRIPVCLLVASALVAQESASIPALVLTTDLGGDPTASILLAPRGCWEGLLLGSRMSHSSKAKPRSGEATVEVWDIAFHETQREQTFRLFRDDLLLSLARALAQPIPSNGQIDFAIVGGYIATHGSAAGVDMAVVQSLQTRFNALPPAGSPVNSRR